MHAYILRSRWLYRVYSTQLKIRSSIPIPTKPFILIFFDKIHWALLYSEWASKRGLSIHTGPFWGLYIKTKKYRALFGLSIFWAQYIFFETKEYFEKYVEPKTQHGLGNFFKKKITLSPFCVCVWCLFCSKKYMLRKWAQFFFGQKNYRAHVVLKHIEPILGTAESHITVTLNNGPVIHAKEPYIYTKRALNTYQKSPVRRHSRVTYHSDPKQRPQHHIFPVEWNHVDPTNRTHWAHFGLRMFWAQHIFFGTEKMLSPFWAQHTKQEVWNKFKLPKYTPKEP